MRFVSHTFSALCAVAAVSKCENPTKRVEWRGFDDAARQQCTDAVLCLSTKPSRLGLDTTLYGDFPYVHAHLYNKETVAKVQAVKDYDHYRQELEAGPHGAVHSAIGGDMIPNTSPNENLDPKTRTMEFAGYKTQDQFDGTKPPPASLDDILLMNGLADDLKVKDLMSIQSSLLCYSY